MSSWHIFSKTIEQIVGRVKVSELLSVQGTQYSEEDLVVWNRTPIRITGHQSVNIEQTGTMRLLFNCGTIVSVLIANTFQS